MKLYKIKTGVVIETDHGFHLLEGENWDTFVNDDNLFGKLAAIVRAVEPIENGQQLLNSRLEAPIQSQELWASGVTYIRSKIGRQEESKNSGGGEFYARVYEAERPELFFKATSHRVVGSGGKVRIRQDSNWNVPEPELTLMITSSGKIVGYTIGNDMSSRSIEGENPLYLPQAKTYDGCAALGPCIYVTEEPLPADTIIHLEIARNNAPVFTGSVDIKQMKRTPEGLVSYLYRECSFPHGSLLMTGAGIIPPSDFSLQSGDEIRITIQPIGMLVNTVK
ncbi:2-hydroxyhepta-2,4-diene-1,7-dioate isomerase [candidate division KSB1 bacterium]|nr:MAG: 2-hydroxyhepta-2,4-diene-1,7-dioate isomerase [candidate division KSB1 bacterium]MBC6946351.1 2-hydroxyhepta-2,4-diene-1,7-dioate isomerase [candidate division KSB1 bacterium]MCE7940704.1 2-hydroxyhepta-2,4-diene-1,7-dioate isomerase [Chlorobi bacterium CHB1]MDL1874087.1 2-hydroxyhepta-2,4-diene-1,7-dioate isomerase [Cytophagia bacterium CHB2]RIK54629.1 MAG: 2-hydroxyhepta-2,4-diene-1,7-dioate isomerase [candidate division KSB1 bacterium]